MPALEVTTRDGAQFTIEAINGSSMMEALRDSGETDLIAMCGGCCACATCHVEIGGEWIARVGEAGEDEADMMSDLANRTPASRLSCQIIMRDELDGIRLRITQEE